MNDLKALTECAECTWDYIDRLRMALASACKERDELKKAYDAMARDLQFRTGQVRELQEENNVSDRAALVAEIEKLRKQMEQTQEERDAMRDPQKLARLRELVLADQAGRLVVLPVKTKETVYVVGEKRIMECFIAEAYIDDARGLEYMVSFDCDDDCDGCPFNSWRQDYSGEYSCDGAFGEGCVLGSGYGKTFFSTREAAEAALAGKG